MTVYWSPSSSGITISGGTSSDLTGDHIIKAALRVLRVVDPVETADAADILTGRQALNLLLQSWAGLKGINIWLTHEACLFLAEDAQTYNLGPTGSYCGVLTDCVKTQLSAAAAASATALAVDSSAGIAAADYVGVELDDGTLHWDVQSGAPGSATSLTLTTGLASAAAADSYVFAFTSKITRPMDILEARIRNVDENDEPLTIVRNREDFFKITDKTSSGETTHLFYDPITTNGRLYTWPVCDDVTKRIVFTMRRKITDFAANTDSFDGPSDAINALKWNLAVDLAPEYGMQISEVIAAKAAETFADVERNYRERKTIRFHP